MQFNDNINFIIFYEFTLKNVLFTQLNVPDNFRKKKVNLLLPVLLILDV